MNAHTHLTEADFMANEASRLRSFAGMIKLCGKTPAQIATACNLDKRTVRRALRGEPVKSDAQARIELFIQRTIADSVTAEIAS